MAVAIEYGVKSNLRYEPALTAPATIPKYEIAFPSDRKSAPAVAPAPAK
jgi:hypothetical protein